MRIAVKDAETGNKINMDLEGDNTVEEVIFSLIIGVITVSAREKRFP